MNTKNYSKSFLIPPVKKFFWMIGILIFFIEPVYSKDCITKHGHGQINWTTGQIKVNGNAVPSNNTDKEIESLPGSARADANRNLIQVLKQIKIYQALSVKKYTAANDKILSGIEKIAREAVTELQTYTSAMDLQVQISIKFYGGFLQLVLPEDIRQISEVNIEKDQGKKFIKTYPEQRRPYTGLIIDAGSVMTEPVLYPVIIDENGKEIYSSQFISREFAVQFGVCSYTSDIETATKQKRVGTTPLLIKAIKEINKNQTFLIISSEDTKKIEKTSERHGFLKECRVIIICRPKTSEVSSNY